MNPTPPPASSQIMEVLLSQADSRGILRCDRFIATALYDPTHGYYRQAKTRVGKSEGTDFYTSESLGTVFPRLIQNSLSSLFPGYPSQLNLVELGEQGEARIGSEIISPGENITFTRPSIVFLHEVLDAQPFRRFRKESGVWRELGVKVTTETLEETDYGIAEELHFLPQEGHPDGFTVDFPSGAIALLKEITGQQHADNILIFDYGLPVQTLLSERPEGTARSYFRHTLGSNPWLSPGQLDITHHLGWEWITDALISSGFSVDGPMRQESFFVHHASSEIERIMGEEETMAGNQRRELMALLHPQHFGSKFQVLVARRIP